MEQRPLRLGDIVDDYCPRERRITNHTVVVMSGTDIGRTRCTACDADHSYRHAKAPLKKKRDGNGALYDEVLAGVLKPAPTQGVRDARAAHEATGAQEVPAAPAVHDVPAVPEAPAIPDEEPVTVAWGHRPLIRAQLPRIDGVAPPVVRPLPEFTIRQQGSRGYGQPNHSNGHGFRRGPGQGGHHQPGNNGNGGGHGRGGRDHSPSNGRPRNSR